MKLILLVPLGALILMSCSNHRIANACGYKTSKKIRQGESQNHVSKHKKLKTKDNRNQLAVVQNASVHTEYEIAVSSLDIAHASIINKSRSDSYENTNSVSKELVSEDTYHIKQEVFMPKSNNLSSNTMTHEELKSETLFSEDPNAKERVIDPISIVSLALAPIGAVVVFLSFVLMNVHLVFPLLLFVGCAVIIAAFILGIISLRRMKKNPHKYKGKGFALGGFIGGLIGTSFILLGTLGVLIYIFL